MPIFNCACTCGNKFEHFDRSISEPTTPVCPECGAEALREIGAPAVHYKGTGFHSTDYKSQKNLQDRVNYLGTPE